MVSKKKYRYKTIGYSGRHEKTTFGYVMVLIVLTIICFSMLYPFYNLAIQRVRAMGGKVKKTSLLLGWFWTSGRSPSELQQESCCGQRWMQLWSPAS